MSDPQPRPGRPQWACRPLLGLLVVLAFLGHDILMAAPASPGAATASAHTLTLETTEPDALASHPHGCHVGQTMVLKASDDNLRPSMVCDFVGHPALILSAFVPSYRVVPRTRPPAAQRAVLQVFRI